MVPGSLETCHELPAVATCKEHRDQRRDAWVKKYPRRDEWSAYQGGEWKVFSSATRRGSSPKRSESDRRIDETVRSSTWILDLSHDWDEEGSPAYSAETWDRAVKFLRNQASWLRQHLCITLEAPRILPGPHGSIDLHWDTDGYELLVNIPANPETPVSFYGDDRGKISIKGTLDPSTYNRGLLMWLAKQG